jgi:ABC-2 type transport system ATP-binding protein
MRMRDSGTTIMLSTHRMESVEELCSHIALINKSRKVLDGSIRDIRTQYKSNIFEIRYKGHGIALANSLWGPYELLENRVEDDHQFALIRLTGDVQPNQLVGALIQQVELLGYKEVIPSMNDVFIKVVQEEVHA